MARQGRNIFPIWNPQKITLFKIFEGMDKKIAFKTFRYSSSGFIAKKIVRSIILEKFNYSCVLCNSIFKLEIDHIKSVIFCFQNNLIYECNIESNLQVLCKTCNSSKLS